MPATVAPMPAAGSDYRARLRELVAQGHGLSAADQQAALEFGPPVQSPPVAASGARTVVHEWQRSATETVRATLNTIGERPVVSLRVFALGPTTNALTLDTAHLGRLEE